jgi:AmmeMemoRadiSam system protein B
VSIFIVIENHTCLQGNYRRRVFVIGPSHHYYLSTCALSTCASYDTPFGQLQLDQPIIEELQKTGEFATIKLHDDEEEHSLEMQLPYIFKMLSR